MSMIVSEICSTLSSDGQTGIQCIILQPKMNNAYASVDCVLRKCRPNTRSRTRSVLYTGTYSCYLQ
jgi:hypothetical protein